MFLSVCQGVSLVTTGLLPIACFFLLYPDLGSRPTKTVIAAESLMSRVRLRFRGRMGNETDRNTFVDYGRSCVWNEKLFDSV